MQFVHISNVYSAAIESQLEIGRINERGSNEYSGHIPYLLSNGGVGTKWLSTNTMQHAVEQVRSTFTHALVNDQNQLQFAIVSG